MITRTGEDARVGLRIGILSFLLTLMLLSSTMASAFWSAQTQQQGSLPMDVTLPAPSSTSCENLSLLLVAYASISWAPVETANGYRVTVTRASGGTPFVVDQTTTSIDLTTGVLGDLLTGLLSPTTLTVTIQPYYDAGAGGRWVSAEFVTRQGNARLLPIGTTCA